MIRKLFRVPFKVYVDDYFGVVKLEEIGRLKAAVKRFFDILGFPYKEQKI